MGWLILRVFLLVTLIAAIFTGCVQQQQQPQPPQVQEVKIGVLAPKTGVFQSAGVAMENAARLAEKHVKEMNLAGNYQITLVIADAGSTPEQATSAFLQLAQQDVVAVVGAYSSAQAIAVAKAAEEAGIVYIASVASTPQLEEMVKQGSSHIFRNAYNTTYWGILAAEFLKVSGAEHYYFVGYDPLKTFNQGMLKVIEERSDLEKLGETYYTTPKVNPDDVKLKAKQAASTVGERDVLILGDPGRLSINFVKEYRANGGKGIVYSVGGTLALPAILEKIKADYTAFQAAALEDTEKTEFTKKYFEDYRKTYEEEANNYAGLLTYDAILILAQALEKGGKDNLIETLEKGTFKGAAGVYRFNENHQALWGSDELQGIIGEYIGGIKVVYPEKFANSGVIWAD
jgi:branched-chain amino acid transport system substrate-binding protein